MTAMPKRQTRRIHCRELLKMVVVMMMMVAMVVLKMAAERNSEFEDLKQRYIFPTNPLKASSARSLESKLAVFQNSWKLRTELQLR
jgi:hypothetical protein